MTSKIRIALTSTERFRTDHKDICGNFLKNNLLWLLANTDICITGKTFDFLLEVLQDLVRKNELTQDDIKLYNEKTIKLPGGSVGIVAVTHELVEGKLAGLIHLSHYKDIHKTFSWTVLKRQSMVHNVTYADSVRGAEIMIDAWKTGALELKYGPSTSPIVDFDKIRAKATKDSNGKYTNNNVALIAHDGKKLELCLFAMQHVKQLLTYDFILATGTTGGWLKKFFIAVRPDLKNELENKFILCESGPKGGDVQIAHVALSGLCSEIIFFIDPMEAHPHEPDIRFFEQVVEASEEYTVVLATNAQSGQYILANK